MKIQFLKDTTLTIVTDFDEATDNITGEDVVHFAKGEVREVDVIEGADTPKYVDIQFVNGSLALGVQRSCFKELE